MSPTLRQPTDRAALYAWHADALDAMRQARVTDLRELARAAPDLMPPLEEGVPQCGWYAAKTSKGSVLVPSRIWLQSVVDEAGELLEPELFQCEIGDKVFDPLDVWAKLAIRPIPVAEYRHMMALRAWARESAPNEPQAVDGRPVDWQTVKVRVPDPAPQPQPQRMRR